MPLAPLLLALALALAPLALLLALLLLTLAPLALALALLLPMLAAQQRRRLHWRFFELVFEGAGQTRQQWTPPLLRSKQSVQSLPGAALQLPCCRLLWICPQHLRQQWWCVCAPA
jgi:hypothetical protein